MKNKRFVKVVTVMLLMCIAGSVLGCSSKKELKDNETEINNEVEPNTEIEEKNQTEINNNEQNNEQEQVIKKSFEDSIELIYLGGKKYVNQVGRGSEPADNGAQLFEFETGYFGYYQDDYDNDGIDEILALTFNGQSTKNESIITYRMYEEDKEGWEQVAAFDMQMESWAEKYWCDFLYQKVNGIPYFFQEQKQVSTFFSDGRMWKINGIKYVDGYFQQLESVISYEGSSDEPDFYTLAEWEKEFAVVGLNINNIDYEQHSFDLSTGIIKLANIQADLNAKFYDSPYETGEAFSVDGIDIIISDYTRAGMSVVQEDNTGNNEYVLPDSNTVVLTRDDIINLNKDELRLARNEILARHGRKFKDVELQAYFDSKSWYTGIILPEDFNDSILNDFEIKNLNLILASEQELQ